MTSSFHDTRWTLVSRSRGSEPEARAALSELCEAYYAPVVAFLRRDGRDEDAARDLAHDFFAKLLVGDTIKEADPLRGRFRTYLLAALKHFAADQRDRALAAKRGGGVAHVVIDSDAGPTGAGLQIEDAGMALPDAAFDRQWALTVLARALNTLSTEMQESGKTDAFQKLKPFLSGDGDTPPISEVASGMGVTEDALKMAIHRMRKRFRDAVKKEISQTVTEPGCMDEEMQSLMSALRGR
jgi:DNA-directed RNA polymerase specialized sigma24 family protein